MSDPGERRERSEGRADPPERRAPFLARILRSTVAPPVLGEGGRDAPLSPRGRLLFWGTVSTLALAIAVLFVLTLASR